MRPYSPTRRDTIYGVRLSVFPLFLTLLLTLLTLTSCDNRDFKETTVTYTIVSFSTTSTTLYDDGGATSVTLEAIVHDNLGRAVPSQSIKFSSDITQVKFETIGADGDTGSSGVVDPASRFQTDGNGSVRAYAKLSGKVLTQSADSLRVNVSVWLNDESRPQRSLQFTLYKEPGIAIIELDANQVPREVNIGTGLELIARPFDEVGNPVTDGVRVTFVVFNHLGYFSNEAGEQLSSSQIDVPCSGGYAKTYWVAGTIAGEDSLYAKIGNIESPIRKTKIKEGYPRSITFIPTPSEVYPDSYPDTVPTYSSPFPMDVYVSDAYHNPIPMFPVRFKSKTSTEENATDIGNISPSSQTSIDGVARVSFNPGNTSGYAYITAACGDSASATMMITIISATGSALQFTNESPVELNIQGSGGVESAFVGVRVLDNNSNLVTNPNKVRFSVTSAPQDVLINGILWHMPVPPETTNPTLIPNPEAVTTVDTFGGIAQVAIGSGGFSGTVTLKAELLRLQPPADPDNPPDPPIYIPLTPPVIVSKNNINIHSGPPSRVELFIPSNSTGINIGAGAWKIVMAANITDDRGNPVLKGTAVNFYLEKLRMSDMTSQNPPQPVANPIYHNIDPLYIHPFAFVGNVSAQGDSVAGVAYSYITYHGTYSNWWVNVRVNLALLEGDDPEVKVQLPMQSPRLTLSANPIEWASNETTVIKNTVITATVRDGQNNPLFNVPLVFTADRGIFSNPPGPNDSWRDVNPPATVSTNTNLDTSPEYPTEGQLDESWSGPAGAYASQFTPFSAVTGPDGKQLKRYYYPRDRFPEAPTPPSELNASILVEIPGVEGTQVPIDVILRLWF